MAFSEATKLIAKQKSFFCCCLCRALGVEVHHIIPQAEGGSDEQDNAAPLCPSCHETYGANPTKRKFIREVRDFWYELCAKRYKNEVGPLALDSLGRVARLEQRLLDFAEREKFIEGKESAERLALIDSELTNLENLLTSAGSGDKHLLAGLLRELYPKYLQYARSHWASAPPYQSIRERVTEGLKRIEAIGSQNVA
jgi:hypothetical protein